MAFVIGRVQAPPPQKGGKKKANPRPPHEESDDPEGDYPTAGAGVFSVTVKYRGVVVDTLRVTIQVSVSAILLPK